MCNVMVGYFKRNEKVQRNKRQIRFEQSVSSRSEQVDQIMNGEIRVDHIRYVERILYQIDLSRMIRLEKSRVKASVGESGRRA